MRLSLENIRIDSPEEVVPTEEFALSTEAFVCEVVVAVDAADAVRMPRPVQHVQQELVEDGLVAARAGDDHRGGGGRWPGTSAWNKHTAVRPWKDCIITHPNTEELTNN